MKQFYLLSAAMLLSVVAIVSCTRIDEVEEVVPGLKEIEFSAFVEDANPASKTMIKDAYSVWWVPDDKISVFAGNGSDGGYEFSAKCYEPSATTKFTGNVPELGSGEHYIAVYPYSASNSCSAGTITMLVPVIQEGAADNFPKSGFPSMAISENNELRFYNICGDLRFTFGRGDIKSVSIKSLNGEALAGTVQAAFGSDGKPEIKGVINKTDMVTLVAPNGGCFEAGIPYFMVLVPGKISGFEMEFATASKKGTFQSSQKNIIKRSIFGNLILADTNVSDWSVNAPEAVDLGLSVKWAPYNYGALSQTEPGDYFAWGEITAKDTYLWTNYLWCGGSATTLTKYCSEYNYGTVDNKMQLDAEDDVVQKNWGGNWRMPSFYEMEELSKDCNWTWTTVDGINGYIIKSKVNDNEIFLPAAGLRYAQKVYYNGDFGMYWSSTSPMLDDSYSLSFDSESAGTSFYKRLYGLSVRPVLGDSFVPVESVSLNKKELTIKVGDEYALTATVLPENATHKFVSWKHLSDGAIVVNGDGHVKALRTGYANVIAYSADGTKSDGCLVRVVGEPEAVDLGLPSGIKWASFNLGASAPEEYGDYFAWGEVERKNSYSWYSYKWSNGDTSELTKYNTKTSCGTVDNKIQLVSEDDAAHAILGASWRMPTRSELQELINNCTCTWTTLNGVNGIRIFGTKEGYTDNSIFIPASGIRSYPDSEPRYIGEQGYCWTSSLVQDDPDSAVIMFVENVEEFNHASIQIASDIRFHGLTIRPVMK